MIKHGTVTASLMLRKLSSYPRQNGLGRGAARKTSSCANAFKPGSTKARPRTPGARRLFQAAWARSAIRSFEHQRYRASGLYVSIAGFCAALLGNVHQLR